MIGGAFAQPSEGLAAWGTGASPAPRSRGFHRPSGVEHGDPEGRAVEHRALAAHESAGDDRAPLGAAGGRVDLEIRPAGLEHRDLAGAGIGNEGDLGGQLRPVLPGRERAGGAGDARLGGVERARGERRRDARARLRRAAGP